MALDIPKIQLDPDNDAAMLAQALQRVRIASKNTITDFSPGNPVVALLEGQVFAQAELSYYMNLLPEALALEVFRLSGTERSEGTRAVGYVTFLLTRPISNDFFVPEGYLINRGDLSYELTEPLNIPAGAVQANVAIRATSPGTAGNVPAYAISTGLGLTHLQSVYNPEPIAGGTDLEPLDTYVRRASRAFREARGTLVSKADYERAARALLPVGYTAVAVPFLTSDRVTESPGNVHIFLLGADNNPINPVLASTVQSQLIDQVPAGFRLWVSPAAIQPLELSITLNVDRVSTELADTVFNSLDAWLSASGVGIGNDVAIDDLRYQCRRVPGVSRVISALVGPSASDRGMPNAYTQATIGLLTLALNDGSLNKTYTYGSPLFGSDLE